MTPQQLATRDRSIRAALETLETVNAGLSKVAIFDQAERMVGSRITELERDSYLKRMMDRGWVRDRRDYFTDQIVYDITDAGRTAMVAL